jgi:flagellin-like hook-associated protein FlgL
MVVPLQQISEGLHMTDLNDDPAAAAHSVSFTGVVLH